MHALGPLRNDILRERKRRNKMNGRGDERVSVYSRNLRVDDGRRDWLEPAIWAPCVCVGSPKSGIGVQTVAIHQHHGSRWDVKRFALCERDDCVVRGPKNPT